MVIVLLGTASADTEVAADALAQRIGWTCEQAPRAGSVRTRVEQALSRREPLVLSWPSGDTAQAAAELRGLPRVRLVALHAANASGQEVLRVDDAADVEAIVGRVRLAFGV